MKITELIKKPIKIAEAIALGGKQGWDFLIRYGYFRIKGRHFTLNFATTFECDNACPICYFYADIKYMIKKYPDFKAQMKDQPLEFWRPILEENAKLGNTAVATGGEPGRRPDLLKLAFDIYREKLMIITNGTRRISPEIQCRIFASLHGPPKIQREMTGRDNFEIVTENMRGDKRYILSPVLSTVNYQYIEYLVKLSLELGIDGVMFSLYTPQILPPGQVDPFLLEGEKLKATVKELHRVLDEYPEAVWLTHGMIDLFESKQHQYGCNLRRGWVKSVDPRGVRKNKCVMGENANCSQCGCIIPVAMRDLENLDRKAIPVVMKFGFKPKKAAE